MPPSVPSAAPFLFPVLLVLVDPVSLISLARVLPYPMQLANNFPTGGAQAPLPRWLPGRLTTGGASPLPLPLRRRLSFSPPAASRPQHSGDAHGPSRAPPPRSPARRREISRASRLAHSLLAAPVATSHGSRAFTAGAVETPWPWRSVSLTIDL
jgi:hypothetical protein